MDRLTFGRSAGHGYDYDAAGNMTHDATTNLGYTFDQENRITGAAGYTYTDDADGNRVEKSNGSTGTIYWYMSLGIVAESDLSGNLKSEYVFFGGERVARKDFSGGTTSVAYYFSDHLKTASVITNSAGVITEDEDYYPWGGELQIVNSDSNHYKFTGKERDSETGLDYFGARYYGNWVGRFLTPDWAGHSTEVPYANFGNPQSLNLYTYGKNNPTTFGDPDGHCLEDACVVEGIIVIGFLVSSYLASPPGQHALQGAGQAISSLFRSSSSGSTDSATRSNKSRLGAGSHGHHGAKVHPGKGSPAPGTQAGAKPKDVYIDPNKYPAAAGHAKDAIDGGKPDVLTVDRPGASDRRTDALKGTSTQPGADRDEYPPAVTKEGGGEADVSRIPSGDNRGAGASVGQQIKDVPDGGKIRIKVEPRPKE